MVIKGLANHSFMRQLSRRSVAKVERDCWVQWVHHSRSDDYLKREAELSSSGCITFKVVLVLSRETNLINIIYTSAMIRNII